MKIILTFHMKTFKTVVLKQAMDELTVTTNFQLWNHR